MTAPVLAFRGCTQRRSQQFETVLRADQLTYNEVGATSGTLPNGFAHGHHSIQLGTQPGAFARAVEGLRGWHAHRAAGLEVLGRPEIVTGEVVVLVLPILAVEARITCRIVSVTESASQFGFAYGTLPCHPEIGEERFVITQHADGHVDFTVDVFWKSRHPIARIGGPITKRVQRTFTDRYLLGLRNWTVGAT